MSNRSIIALIALAIVGFLVSQTFYTVDPTKQVLVRQFGAIVGDRAEVGCNAVLNPGSLLGRRALVMPTVAFSGYLPANTLARIRANVSHLPRRD